MPFKVLIQSLNSVQLYVIILIFRKQVAKVNIIILCCNTCNKTIKIKEDEKETALKFYWQWNNSSKFLKNYVIFCHNNVRNKIKTLVFIKQITLFLRIHKS